MNIAMEFCGHAEKQAVVRLRGEFVKSFPTVAEAESFVGRVEALRERESLLCAEAVEIVLRHPSMSRG